MNQLNALLISDGRPGHYHLAEGVLAAIARHRSVSITRRDIARRPYAPARLLAAMLKHGLSPAAVLRLGYGITARALPKVDLVVSAGGDTIAANVVCARLLKASNIFCGSLRHVPPEAMSLTISSYAAHADRPHHIVTLKPSGIDPDKIEQHASSSSIDASTPPHTAGLLIGGKSGQFTFEQADWEQLIDFLRATYQTQGTRWIVSTSRRTDEETGDRFAALAAQDNSPICNFIDFRTSGPGTLPSLFSSSQAIACTADSSSMISEAVCARRAVIGITPAHHSYTRQEAQYRQVMLDNNWTSTIALAELTPQTWLTALNRITPLQENHLDTLAARLKQHLPQLFSG